MGDEPSYEKPITIHFLKEAVQKDFIVAETGRHVLQAIEVRMPQLSKREPVVK